MNSCLYTGTLRHRRFAPRPHHFEYRLFMMFLDLGELDQVFRGRWFWSAHRPALAWLRRRDYLGNPELGLDESVRRKVEKDTGIRPQGPIRMLTHLRMFGHCFNPVSFYYCYDKTGTAIESLVVEITNTPWKERHTYVLPARDSTLHFRFGKSFHVSPFMPMALQYDWRFNAPAARLAVHMENHDDRGKLFDATLSLQRREIGTASLAGMLARFPFMTLQVVGAIYWQALKLWARRTPFFAHP
ncbi:MAG: DUF1365 domain-containing protein [Burkholderiales bacterium]